MDVDREKKLLINCMVSDAILVTLSTVFTVSGEVIGVGTEAPFLSSLLLGLLRSLLDLVPFGH